MNAKNHKYEIAILLVTVLVVTGCQPAPQAQPTATLTAIPQPSATPQPTATQTLPPPTATATSTAVPSPTATPAPMFTHIYAFGDDFSDNGNMYKAAKEAFEKKEITAEDFNWPKIGKAAWDATKGAVAVEFLADLLKTGLTSYGYTGATSGYDCLEYKDHGLFWQIDKLKSDLNGKKADADALFIIEIAGNDLPKHWYGEDDLSDKLSDKAVTKYADETVANIGTAVTRLAEVGAKQFLVGSGFDVASYPATIDSINWMGVDTRKPWTVFQNRMRFTIPVVMDGLAGQLNVKISVFDFIAAEEHIRKNASQYGITNLTDPCTNMPYFDKICESPDEYYYFHSYAYTGRVHQIWAEMIAEQLSK